MEEISSNWRQKTRKIYVSFYKRQNQSVTWFFPNVLFLRCRRPLVCSLCGLIINIRMQIMSLRTTQTEITQNKPCKLSSRLWKWRQHLRPSWPGNGQTRNPPQFKWFSVLSRSLSWQFQHLCFEVALGHKKKNYKIKEAIAVQQAHARPRRAISLLFATN